MYCKQNFYRVIQIRIFHMCINVLLYIAQVLQNQQDTVYTDYAYKVLMAIILKVH